jgi:hypothetical protein
MKSDRPEGVNSIQGTGNTFVIMNVGWIFALKGQIKTYGFF